MDKEKYHHGNLKEEMIKEGLKLLNVSGYEKFSLRKVAKMCGVSHTAPYKHFKNKDELIYAIMLEVLKKFTTSLDEIVHIYEGNPRVQIIEMGKQYVKFMVENPDYLKFLFLNNFIKPIVIDKSEISCTSGSAFEVFKNSALRYLNYINKNENLSLDILTMWSIVHGIAMLLANGSVSYSGDYMELVDQMLNKFITKAFK